MNTALDRKLDAMIPPDDGPDRPRSIVVIGYRWCDVHGNTYHVARIVVDGKLVHTTDLEYGYGDGYEDTAWTWIDEHVIKPRRLPERARHDWGGRTAPHAWCTRMTIAYFREGIDVRRKRDLPGVR